MKYTVDSDAYAREVERVLHKFADVIGLLQIKPDYAQLKSLANRVDGVAAALGLPGRSPVALVDTSDLTPQDFIPQDFKEE